MTTLRRLLRHATVPALGLALATLTLGIRPAAAQQAKEPPPKEVTDGFFDVPARDPSEIPDEIGLPALLFTAALAGGAVFLVCKSARRS